MSEREFRLPDLGEGLGDAVLVRWLVEEGAKVELNQPIVEIETAKATVEIPSPFEGTIVRRHWDVGSSIPVGARLVTYEVADGAAMARGRGGAGVRAVPAARRRARELGVDLDDLAGSGPEGRVTLHDVERVARGEGDAVVGGADGLASAAELETESVEVTPARVAAASALERQAAIPQVTTFRTVDCAALEEVRLGLGVSPLPFVAAALAQTCAAHPRWNASWTGNGMALRRSVNLGLAIDTERGLVLAVVRDAQELGVPAMAEAIDRLARAAREGSLTPADVGGATVAISNVGSYGSEAGTPLLAPETAVTVGLGIIEPRALVVEGRVVARPACTLSVTFDHRVLDGADVGRPLGVLVASLEDAHRLESLAAR